MAVANNRIYVADYEMGLLVLCSLPNLQVMLRVDATPGVPCMIEAAPHLRSPIPWTPLFTTNPVTTPFEFTDLDVSGPQKFYRARQP